MPKITDAQRRALAAMPFSYSKWGDKLMTSLPDGVYTTATLFALMRMGLASVGYDRAIGYWRATDAGRKMLEETES